MICSTLNNWERPHKLPLMRVETVVCQELYVPAAVFLAKFGAEKEEGPIKAAGLSPKTVFPGCSGIWALS